MVDEANSHVRRVDVESPTRTQGDDVPVDAAIEGALQQGQVLGQRYQIRAFLGLGGMGEVWRAFDLKLRVNVALKALRSRLAADPSRLELIRREVRAARDVTSQNVCRIYDLVELDGTELVSMEFVDGRTLLEVMRERAPMDPPEAQQIASQFLAGLEAIHQVGLVHRDVKPENIMVTRTGRVVLMDFGLARSSAEGAGTVSGTPAYMAPEQALGGVDARSDLFSAGVILAEMVSPGGVRDFDSRKSVWEGIRQEPVRVPSSPWAPVVKRAVAKDPTTRFQTARDLIRALEDVAFRVHDETGLEPYPGLASFDEDDATYFFGREPEVEAVWTRLQSAQLVGIIGASGSGKSSFLGAGLVPARPDRWAVARCTPGSAAIASLRRVIVSEIQEDATAVTELASGGDGAITEAFAAWRDHHDEALLIVDQFEELFTQNTSEEQERCAEVLGRIAIDADVHVLLSMRDDFLMRCHEHETLAPIFSELTPLRPPVGGALRRAVVQPALRCGYRFEDEELADEILAEVEGERGVLPLLAFALARLWEQRDRENGLITRQAYRDIGGVGGALAQHAEALMERLGPERHSIVREIFRNLVTAQGTRAARDVDELLSVFDSEQSSRSRRSPAGAHPLSSRASKGAEGRRESRDPPKLGATMIEGAPSRPGGGPSTRSDSLAQDDRQGVASAVLHELIDARLLTSFEVPSDNGPGRQRVDVIHESLLTSWPRLVRWQAQDAEGALLRDQLRQAAAAWDERGRSDDLVWTGAAFREFRVWRDRYPGGLTGIEEAFAAAMTSLASRRRRRRRIAVASMIVLLATGLAVVGTFWQRSERETRRAEAANLVSMGQLELESYPSAAVAHAIASLELADSRGARRLALEALWKGPTALVVNDHETWQVKFTSDGDWLIQSDLLDGPGNDLRLIGKDGSSNALDRPEDWRFSFIGSNPTGEVLWSTGQHGSQQQVGLWSIPDGRKLAETRYEPPAALLGPIGMRWSGQRLLVLIQEGAHRSIDAVSFDGSIERLGSLECDPELGRCQTYVDVDTGRWLGVIEDGAVSVMEIGEHGLSERRALGRHDGSGLQISLDPQGRAVATSDDSGEIRLWDPSGTRSPRVVRGPPGVEGPRFWGDGSVLVAATREDGEIFFWVWSLATDPPTFLRKIDRGPEGQGASDWDTEGARLATCGPDQKIRIHSLQDAADAEPLTLLRGDIGKPWWPSFHPRGDLLATSDSSGLTVWPLARRYPAIIRRHQEAVRSVVFEAEGRWLASGSQDETVRLWPLEGAVPAEGRIVFDEGFAVKELKVAPRADRLTVGGDPGQAAIVPLDGSPPTVLGGFIQSSAVALSADERTAAVVASSSSSRLDLVVWEVGAWDEPTVLMPDERLRTENIHILRDGRILTAGEALWRTDPRTGESEPVYRAGKEDCVHRFSVSQDETQIAVVEVSQCSIGGDGRAALLDLDADTVTPLDSHGGRLATIALDQKGTVVVTGDRDGVVRVGPVTGEEPHLLLGHEGRVWSVAIDPLGRWIASGGQDGTVRLWPMPDLSKPPLHTLPREELIAKLKTLTNLRVVRDDESATGWKLTHDPFPGWETVPTW